MTQHRYSTEVGKNMARALGSSLPISTKAAVEICSSIRNKNLQKAKQFLEQVILLKSAVPYRRYNKDVPHRKAIGPGRYPVKAAGEIINILNSAEANAKNKGMDINSLYITHINAHLAQRPWHYGRQTRRKTKRTHIEVVVAEKKDQEDDQKKRIKKKND